MIHERTSQMPAQTLPSHSEIPLELPDQRAPNDRPKTRRSAALLVVVGLLGVCLFCTGMLAALNAYSQSSVYGGMAAEFCVGFTTTPRFQVGFYWSLPIFSYLPPLAMAPTHICLYIPVNWQLMPSWLPRQIAFPP